MLAFLLRFERFVVILRDGYVRKNNRLLLYGLELAEIAIEKDDRDATEVFLASTKLIKLFIHSV